MLVQHWMVCFVVAAFEHDTDEIGESVADDLPIPGTGLGIAHHNICSDLHTLGSRMCRKILPRRPYLIQEKRQIPLFAKYTNAAQDLSRPGFRNGYDPAGIVARLLLVVRIQACIAEVGLWVQAGPDSALDTSVSNEEIEKDMVRNSLASKIRLCMSAKIL